MIWRSPKPRYDVASAIRHGACELQEDALVTDFTSGADSGIVVLADGMGGHAAGDIASKIVVTEVFSELKFHSATFAEREPEIPTFMRNAASVANDVVGQYVDENPRAKGMGATLVALVMVEHRLYWVSIGDSPLYLLRDGVLHQINEDHSMSKQVDFMVERGLITPEKARTQRNCLTSAVVGRAIPKTDLPSEPLDVRLGDIVVAASDGLQFLDDAKISGILHRYRRRSSAEIAERLVDELDTLDHPDQDNISLAVIKLNHLDPVIRASLPKREAHYSSVFVEDDDDDFDLEDADRGEVVALYPDGEGDDAETTFKDTDQNTSKTQETSVSTVG
ncbi:MAG: protein phosphatase 2C domain-containing protein [Pseudomonadota bacterium]